MVKLYFSEYSNYLEKQKRNCLIKQEMKESVNRALHKVGLYTYENFRELNDFEW